MSSSDIKSQDGDDEAQTSTPGEAVLTGGDATSIVSQAKITREQVRAKNKESLQEIIDNKQLTGEQKKKAVNEMVELTKIAEKEAGCGDDAFCQRIYRQCSQSFRRIRRCCGKCQRIK